MRSTGSSGRSGIKLFSHVHFSPQNPAIIAGDVKRLAPGQIGIPHRQDRKFRENRIAAVTDFDLADFLQRLTTAALHKVSNPDIYTTLQARFVDTFSRVGIPPVQLHDLLEQGFKSEVPKVLTLLLNRFQYREFFIAGHHVTITKQVL